MENVRDEDTFVSGSVKIPFVRQLESSAICIVAFICPRDALASSSEKNSRVFLCFASVSNRQCASVLESQFM